MGLISLVWTKIISQGFWFLNWEARNNLVCDSLWLSTTRAIFKLWISSSFNNNKWKQKTKRIVSISTAVPFGYVVKKEKKLKAHLWRKKPHLCPQQCHILHTQISLCRDSGPNIQEPQKFASEDRHLYPIADNVVHWGIASHLHWKPQNHRAQAQQ